MKSPFKFLDAYSKEERDIFFGRDKEIEEIYTKLFNGNLLLLYGASGTGKTSIINCGIANKFQDTDWSAVNIRRKNNIIDSIWQEFKKQAITPLDEIDELHEAIHSVYLDYFKPIYIIFDQFEELFISGDENEKLSFLNFLSDILKRKYSLKIIITIREEYIANFSMFEKQIPGFFDNRYRIEYMMPLRVKEVIQKTCSKFNIQIKEPEVPEKIIDNISSSKAVVELTYLQVYLDRLYRMAASNGSVVFSLELLKKVGSISDVLALFLEEQINTLAEPELAWTILKAFVTEGGTKKTTSTEMVKNFLNERNYNVSEKTINDYTKKFLELKIIKYLDE